MFKVINDLIARRDLAPGTYDLLGFVPNKKDPSLTAAISNARDMSSPDYSTRALVFGNESARISGKVSVNPDGSKAFKQIEIRPLDTNFDFEHNTWNVPLEAARRIARTAYDPENRGVRYEIQYRGPGSDGGVGRIYDTFTDSQLNAALHREFAYPHSGPPWLLPSVTGKPPLPFVQEYGQYLDQMYGNNSQALTVPATAPVGQFGSPVNRNANDIGNWIASLAGVDPLNPTQPAGPQKASGPLGIVSNEPMPDWPFPPPIFNTR